MASLLTADGLHRLGVIVKDLRASAEEFSRFFGIKYWDIHRIDRRRLSHARLRGQPVQHSYLSAVGSTSGVALELVQPLDGDSVFSEFLERRGEGMHHLLTTVCAAAEFEPLRDRLEANGIRIAQSGSIDDALDCYFLDTRDMLAGPLIQVLCPRGAVPSIALKPDETIRFDARVTNWNRLPVQKIYHACIVTKRRREQVRDALQSLLGIEKWFDFANESDVSAVDTTLYGRPCNIAFNLSLGRRNTLCVEVVEEVYGRSIYTEFLEQVGEGLQHLMVSVCSEQDFQGLQDWLASENLPVIMGGHAASRDFCYYGYLDTRSRLAGITMEFLLPAGEEWLKGRAEAGEILIGPDVLSV
jgi:methylmalonyl-CoA/ethylmalonyl-CoA epimerase